LARGDQARRRLRADALNGREQRPDLVVAQQTFDITLESTKAPAQQVEILTGVAHLDAIGLAVMASHGARR